MPAFFPTLLPDELFYSAVARYAAMSGQSRSGVRVDLFGRPTQHCEPAFHDFGPTLLAEHLSRDPAIGPLNPHTLRAWMIVAGLWKSDGHAASDVNVHRVLPPELDLDARPRRESACTLAQAGHSSDERDRSYTTAAARRISGL